jgi:hypothetical protein
MPAALENETGPAADQGRRSPQLETAPLINIQKCMRIIQ